MDDGTKALAKVSQNIDITDSRWVCPCCKTIPAGTNFKIIITDTTPKMSGIDWVEGRRLLSFKNVDIGAPNSGEVVRDTAFEGCFECLCAGPMLDSLTAALFKALWSEVRKQQPIVSGRRMMPNIGHGRILQIHVT